MPVDLPAPIELETFQRDGRPLCTVPLTREKHAEIGAWLRPQVKRAQVSKRTAIYFVLWAAEHIRANFQGGRLTWDFVFGGLGLPGSLEVGQIMVDHGLRWWNRSVRVTAAHFHLYLYTLMAEGGLPQALLIQQGLYGRVVKGLLADIEAEGNDIPEELAYRIAAQRVEDLPQTFRTEDITRLLAEFGLSLVKLRKLPPQDVPAEAIDRWLDLHCPGWESGLPLRISREVADRLIRPALREERASLSSAPSLAQRALIRDERTKRWTPVVRLASKGVLSASLLPVSAQGLRLRFQFVGQLTDRGSVIVYSASPIENGWEIQRLGRGADLLTFDLGKPVVLAGYADGQLVGEVEIVPALSLEDESSAFWKEAGLGELGTEPSELLLMGEILKTRLPRIWLYTKLAASPNAGAGVFCGERQEAENGWLWPLQGKGSVSMEGQSWQIVTGADQDSSPVRMLAQGQILPSWRLATTGGQVYLGRPAFYGQIDISSFRPVSVRELRIRPARVILSEIAEWLDRGICVARMRYVALPASARLEMTEEAAGRLTLHAEGFPAEEDWSLVLEAGSATQRIRLTRGAGRISLSSAGAPPGIVWLRIASAGRGEIRFVAPWPARNGFLLRPDGHRLERNLLLSGEALRGWSAVVPQGRPGEVFLRLEGQWIAVRVNGETSLTAFVPLIRSMLAYAGPDSVVKLSLLINSVESPRLDIRRYQQESECTPDGKLLLGLNSGGRVTVDTAPGPKAIQNIVELHAVNLQNPEKIERLRLEGIESPVEIDLKAVLPVGGTAWILQPLLNGEVQRAKVWFPVPQARSSRAQRIREYAQDWRLLAASQERAEWSLRWELMQAVMEGGDAGILDQVQALAQTPTAAVRLLLSVSKADLPQALALEMAAPIFWPALPVAAFVEALKAEYASLIEQFTAVFENVSEARESARDRIAKRIEGVLLLHPELAAHFGIALMEAGLFFQAPAELLQKVVVVDTPERLIELAHEAARRLDWVPSGVEGLVSRHRPQGMPMFNADIQKVIDAPLVAAEIAAGLRTDQGSLATALRLIVLRMADPHYFDSALPVALAILLKEVSS
jgi:hypothetical protein